jgi:formylmethanofuran dehydrogenase subunit C
LISPDQTAKQSNDTIRALPVYLGKRQCRLDEFFDVEGADSDQIELHGGTIILCKGAEIRTGAWMFRGTIVSLAPITLLPTFSGASAYNSTSLRIYAKHLQKLGVRIPVDSSEGFYVRYSGDSAVPGKGEIFVWQPE